MFAALIAALGAAELSEVMRFDAAWERDASLRLRAGDFSAVPAYDRRGRIRGGDRETACNRAAGAWLADHLHGKDTRLLAGSNEEAAELARRVQAQLVKMGTVVHPGAPLADGNRAGTGDLIRARLNTGIDAGGARLTNRDVLRIEGWQGQHAEVTRKLPGGGWSGRFLVPRDSATEQIRASQEWASGTGHVLNLWAAAIRPTFTPYVDRAFRQALSESDYARYVREHQRPALLDALRGWMLAGQDTWAAIREITQAPMNGARSVAAVLHHRLAGLAKPDALLSWAARTPEGAGEIAQATAQALDARAAALGDRLLAEPEPWVVRHLGPPPHEAKPGLQAMLQADYARRAGIAQSYREAAGVADPHQVIRWEGHKGNPSWKRSGTTRSAPCRSATSKPT